MKYELLIPILQNEYNNTFEQKSKLEAKAIGYFTVVSLIMSLVCAVFIVTFPGHKIIELEFIQKYVFLSSISVIIFGLYTIITLLYSLFPRRIDYIKIKKIQIPENDNNDQFEIGIVKSYTAYNDSNKKVVHKISEANEFAYWMLVITVEYFILFFISFVISLF
jgi:hypothetical protein